VTGADDETFNDDIADEIDAALPELTAIANEGEVREAGTTGVVFKVFT